MTYPHSPLPGGFRPGPPTQAPRPGPPTPEPAAATPDEAADGEVRPEPNPNPSPPAVAGTGHPAVDAVLQSLANAVQLAPADQIAEYEAAHRVLQETLTSIDG